MTAQPAAAAGARRASPDRMADRDRHEDYDAARIGTAIWPSRGTPPTRATRRFAAASLTRIRPPPNS